MSPTPDKPIGPGRRIAPPAVNGTPRVPVARRSLSEMTAAASVAGEAAIIVAAGPPKCGKTTFAFGAPNPYFVLTDRGGLRVLPRSWRHKALPDAWDDLPGVTGRVTVMGVLRALRDEEHDRRTVVIDTINRAETFLWSWLARRAGVESIEAVDGGFSKGFIRAKEQFEEMISILFDLREKRGMGVIIISHQLAKMANNPTGDEYERWQLSLHEKAAGVILAAADTILFAEPEIVAAVEGKGPGAKRRGAATGVVKAYVRPRKGIDAGNRDLLPPEMILSWAVYEAETEKGAALKETLFAYLATLPADARVAADTYLAQYGWTRAAVEQVIAGFTPGEAPVEASEGETQEGTSTEETTSNQTEEKE